MSTVEEIGNNYVNICRQLAVQPHHFVTKLFDFLSLKRRRGDVYFDLSGNNYLMTMQRIFDADLLPICKLISLSPTIRSVDFRYNKITDIGAVILAQLLESNNSIKILSLQGNDIGPEGSIAIANSLKRNVTLKGIQMAGNKIGKKGGMAFAEALQLNRTVETVDLGDCDLDIDSVIALATVIRSNPVLKFVNVSRPLLTSVQEELCIHYGEMLHMNKTLDELHLEKCDIRDFGAARLSDALCLNKRLRYLNLNKNRITRDGAGFIAVALQQNYNLTHLDLSVNRIEDPGAIVLAQCLEGYNTTLKCLVVSYNNIKSDGLVALATMMNSNFSLEEIYVWGNIFDDRAARAFAMLLDVTRLTFDKTDIRTYEVDEVMYVAELNNQPTRHRFYMPFFGDDVPEQNKGYSDYARINGSARDGKPILARSYVYEMKKLAEAKEEAKLIEQARLREQQEKEELEAKEQAILQEHDQQAQEA